MRRTNSQSRFFAALVSAAAVACALGTASAQPTPAPAGEDEIEMDGAEPDTGVDEGEIEMDGEGQPEPDLATFAHGSHITAQLCCKMAKMLRDHPQITHALRAQGRRKGVALRTAKPWPEKC